MDPARRYEATVYHDDPEDAATDSRSIGVFIRRSDAVGAIRSVKRQNDYWNSVGQIQLGDYYSAVRGVSPERFEADDSVRSWLVGDDYVERG